jgi:hypothetical protein
MPNARLFQESITKEIDVIKDRVRNLIDSHHWGEHGRFREAVLKNVISKFLPTNLSIGTGFIFRDRDNDGRHILMSAQLDLIIYDNTIPSLFKEGDFVMTTMENVRGIIEVKSTLDPTRLRAAVEQFDSSLEEFHDLLIPNENQPKKFLGVFAFDWNGNIESNVIERDLRASSQLVNHFSLGTDYLLRKWLHNEAAEIGTRTRRGRDFYNVYRMGNLSHSYFISNLIDICSKRETDGHHWFNYPIEGTKETTRIKTISL